MKHFYIFAFLFLVFSEAFSQKQQNVWYFGHNAGLDFNSGLPVATNTSKLKTQEGCVSIADETGNLLFYSDGVTVWNKNHVPMANGTGLMGHESTSQSVIAVPKPGAVGIYYLFTVDALEAGLQGGLRYSVADLNQNNGAGAVTTKNVHLETPVTEKLTAVLHRNGFHYWILVHKWNSDRFSAYLLTENGISTTPRLSYDGEIHQGVLNNSQGCMKASPSGSKLALASNSNLFELFDFNNLTGEVSFGRSSSPTYMLTYGVEFSPDETKLYGSTHNNEIYQFDLTQSNVFGTGIQIGTYELAAPRAALQLGPDNKIYKARVFSGYLGVINKPNLRGTACNYVNDGAYLGGFWGPSGQPTVSQYGLPAFPAGGFGINSFSVENTCAGYPVNFTIPNYKPAYQVSWNFGDPASGSQNSASDPAPVHTFSSPGTYTVTLMLNINGYFRNITREIEVNSPPDASLGQDTVLCEGRNLTIQKPHLPGVQYLWQDGSTNNYYLIMKPGTYSLQVKNNKCIVTDSISVAFKACSNSGLASLLPNVVTPNGDGLNDRFNLAGLGDGPLSLKIYNRWGMLIYENETYRNDWDAKDVFAGEYYYFIQSNSLGMPYKGWVEVVK